MERKEKFKNKQAFIDYINKRVNDDYNKICHHLEVYKLTNPNRDMLPEVLVPFYIIENQWMIKKILQKSPIKTYHLIKNIMVDINVFEKVINDKILDYLNYNNDIVIEPYQYERFLMTIHHIEFFKQSRLSTHKPTYEREIKQIKKKADELQYYSNKQIEIRLPQLPQFTLAYFVDFSKIDMDETTLRYLHDYFIKNNNFKHENNKFKHKNYPKTITLEKTWEEASKEYSKSINSNMFDEFFTYKPPRNLSVQK